MSALRQNNSSDASDKVGDVDDYTRLGIPSSVLEGHFDQYTKSSINEQPGARTVSKIGRMEHDTLLLGNDQELWFEKSRRENVG
jgi:hypothetical protein